MKQKSEYYDFDINVIVTSLQQGSNDSFCFRETLVEGLILHKSLLLMNVTVEDFKSKFTCVVTNTSGMAQKRVRLSAPRGLHVSKRKETLGVTAVTRDGGV